MRIRKFLLGAAALLLTVAAGAAPIDGRNILDYSTPPTKLIAPLGLGNDIVFIGDSITVNGCSNTVPPFTPNSTYLTGGAGRCIAQWVAALSAGGLDWTPSDGYGGNYDGILKVYVVTGGTCTVGQTVTWQASVHTETPGADAGTISAVVASNGSISGVLTPSSQGYGYAGKPSWTQTVGTTCSVQPTFEAVLGGSGTFGVSGDTIADVNTRFPDWGATKRSFCNSIVATNNFGSSVPLATTKAQMLAHILLLQATCGVAFVHTVIPRGGSNVLSTANEQNRVSYNRWLLGQGRMTRADTGGYAPVVIVDSAALLTDTNEATGTLAPPIAGMMYDGKHPESNGAREIAIGIVNAAMPYMHTTWVSAHAATDIYDAANMPGGNLLGTKGLMWGTGGIKNGVTGTCADNWTCRKNGGIATCTAVGSSDPRTDQTSGVWQRLQFDCTNDGGASEQYQIQTTATATNISAGDQIFLQMEIDVGNLANVSGVAVRLSEANSTNQQGLCFGTPQSGSILTSSAAMALRNILLPNFGMTSPGSYTMYCETDPITLQSGSPTYQVIVTIYFVTNGSVHATGDIRVGSIGVYKVSP